MQAFLSGCSDTRHMKLSFHGEASVSPGRHFLCWRKLKACCIHLGEPLIVHPRTGDIKNGGPQTDRNLGRYRDKAVLSQDEKNWGMFCHVAPLPGLYSPWAISSAPW